MYVLFFKWQGALIDHDDLVALPLDGFFTE